MPYFPRQSGELFIFAYFILMPIIIFVNTRLLNVAIEDAGDIL